MYSSSEATAQARLEPFKGCGIVGALQGTIGINGALPVIHGPVSCSSGYRMIPLLADKEPLVPTTALTDVDLVMGTDQRLADALAKAWRVYQPRLITVILTCAVSLSGEGFNRITKKFTAETGCPVLVIDGSGIAGEESRGYKEMYYGFRKLFGIPNDSCGSERLCLDGFSLTDFALREDLSEIRSLLESNLGITTGPSLFMDFDLEKDLATYQESDNLLLGHMWDEGHETSVAPYGINGTFSWLKWVSRKTNRSLPRQAHDNYQSACVRWQKETANLGFKDLRVAIEGDSWWALGLAKFLKTELDVPVIVSTDEAGFRYHRDNAFADQCYADVSGNELNLICHDFGANLVFGSSNVKNKTWQWIAYTQPIWHAVENKVSFMGYSGALRLLDILQTRNR